MKHISLKIAALAISLFGAGPLWAQDAALPVRTCNWCHGVSAQGYSTAPRIAGQRAQYIEKQFSVFRSHMRDNPYSQKFMWNAVANLTPETARELAAYYATLPPQSANDGNRDLVAAGRSLYEEGNPEANVVACIVCHGPKGEGVREIPRLGGLSSIYVKRRLEQWNEGYHAAAKRMEMVSRTLSAHDVEAIASYLSFVE